MGQSTVVGLKTVSHCRDCCYSNKPSKSLKNLKDLGRLCRLPCPLVVIPVIVKKFVSGACVGGCGVVVVVVVVDVYFGCLLLLW